MCGGVNMEAVYVDSLIGMCLADIAYYGVIRRHTSPVDKSDRDIQCCRCRFNLRN